MTETPIPYHAGQRLATPPLLRVPPTRRRSLRRALTRFLQACLAGLATEPAESWMPWIWWP